MYCRDISKKIRAGFKQKQKEGIVIIPPMGYYKDKNTGKVVIVEEQAEIVRRIHALYLEGYGLKAIAKMLNQDGVKSQGYYQEQVYGKNVGRNKPELAKRFQWENTKVKRILQNEFYAGTLICHKSYTSRINHVRKDIPLHEQYRHEGAVPAIISRGDFEHVQLLLSEKQKKKVRASAGKPFHRYTGLIKCGDCGSSFTCKTRHTPGKPDKYEYVCNGYQHYGKSTCTSHRISEEQLDELIYEELRSARLKLKRSYDTIEEEVSRWLHSKDNYEKSLNDLQGKLERRIEDQKEILLERIRDKTHADVYTDMLKECESDIEKLTRDIDNLKNIGETVRKRRLEMKSGIDLINEIIESRTVSPATLRLLIDEIKIWEKDGKLSLTIGLKVKFNGHIEMFNETGEVVDNALFIDDYYDPDLQEELEYYYEKSGTEEDVDLYDFVEGENFSETGEWILVP